MSEFSHTDISEAKRRVEEMRKKAHEYTREEKKETAPLPKEIEESVEKAVKKEERTPSSNIFDLLGNITSGDDSSLLLALILILSHEKADNMVILALLYILL